jgi:uncharacterized protein YlxP (DUF503 family)
VPRLEAEKAGVVTVFVGTLRVDLLLGDVRSLKQKRSVVRPLVAALRRFDVTAAETGDADLHRRAEVGVACVSNDPSHCREVLESCERAVAQRPEVEVLSARLRVVNEEDL